jgi:hypothetical protein
VHCDGAAPPEPEKCDDLTHSSGFDPPFDFSDAFTTVVVGNVI